MSYQKKPRQKYIRCLERRMEYLEKRVTSTDQDLSYDKAELNALRWAVGELKLLYPNQVDAAQEGTTSEVNSMEVSG